LTAGADTFTHDDEGQLSAKNSTTYTFDYEHRLKSIGSSIQYFYDGMGNRVSAVRNGVTTKYIYDASGNLLAEADVNNVIQRYYIYGNGLRAMVTAGGQLYCYHYNATGNTIAITDSSQNIVNKYAYTPFGEIGNEQETFAQPFKYVGQYGVMSESNGLYYMRARYYDPTLGRFISEDPAGFRGGDVNLYVYVGNNPVLLIDPSGLCSQSFFQKFETNYNSTLNGLYGEDLEWADSLGLWGASALAVEIGMSSVQSLTDALATEQIANGKIAGSFVQGDLFSKLQAADIGANTAARTTALRTGMRVTGAVTGVITAGATGYSLGARLNAAAIALYQSF
jgi:RHS repeat-associated protein